MALRTAFTSVSDAVFPGSRGILDGKGQLHNDRKKINSGGTYLVSNLALQMALYFNCCFSPFWVIICVMMLFLKYEKLNQYYKFVLIVVYVVMVSIEVVRLFLGYAGNLQEKVPELAGFWLVTLVLQLPLICFLLFNEAMLILPMERAANIVMLIFVAFEIIQGYRAVKRMTDSQVQKFHLRQMEEYIEMDDLNAGNVG